MSTTPYLRKILSDCGIRTISEHWVHDNRLWGLSEMSSTHYIHARLSKVTCTAKDYRCQTVNKYFGCSFAVRLLSDVSDDECSCALFVHWNICAQIVNRTFVQKRLTNILDVSLLSVCAQMVDEYFGRLFAVRLCTNG